MTLVYSLDVSNWSGEIGDLIAAHKPSLVIVRLSTESAQHREIARQQLTTARVAGCMVGGYIWASWDVQPELRTADALRVADGFDLQLVALDCEEGEPGQARLEDWLSRAVAQVESQGQRAWVYARKDWWRRQGDSTGFARLPLWAVQWDGIPDLDIVGVFGGWSKASGKQWSGGDVDRNVFDADAIHPSVDPCAALRNGLRAELARPRLSRKRLAALLP